MCRDERRAPDFCWIAPLIGNYVARAFDGTVTGRHLQETGIEESCTTMNAKPALAKRGTGETMRTYQWPNAFTRCSAVSRYNPIAQLTEPRDRDFHDVSRNEAPHSGWRSRIDEIAGLQFDQAGKRGDDLRQGPDHL